MALTPWKDLTPEQHQERVAKIKAGVAASKQRKEEQKAAAAAERAAAAELEAVERAGREAAIGVPPEPVMITLSNEEIAKIRAKAIEDVTAERKKELIAAELVRQKNLVRRSMGVEVEEEAGPAPEPDQYSFRPQLAEFAPHLRIDGRYFFHGVTYHGLSKAQYDTMRYMEAQTWTHQATIDGKRQNYYNQNSRLWQQSDGGHPVGHARTII